MKSEAVKRLCALWQARYEAPRLEQPRWWSALLDWVQPDQVIAVRGLWPLQRHVLAQFVASLGRNDDATLRGPTALLEEIIEETLTLRAGLAREQVRRGFLDTSNWEALAMAAGATTVVGFNVNCIEGLDGVVLESCARWCFGTRVPHPDVEIEVVMTDGVIHLDAIDGSCTPPVRRRARLLHGRLQLCDDSEPGFVVNATANNDDNDDGP